MNREITIDLRRCVIELVNKWWLIVIVTLIFFLMGLLMTLQRGMDVYSAKSTVYSIAYGSYSQSVEGTKAMQSYADVVKSLKVSERAAMLLGEMELTGRQIMSMINVSYKSDSPILTISAYSSDPKQAIEVSKAVANAFIIEIKNITGSDTIQILDEAYDATVSYNIEREQMKKRILMTGMGFVVTCLGIVLNTIFTDKVYSVSDATLNGKLEILGVIPRTGK